jgi:hypothetical protein
MTAWAKNCKSSGRSSRRPESSKKVGLPEPTDFDPPDKLDAFLDAVRWGAASTANVKNIEVPFRSGIGAEDDLPRRFTFKESPSELRIVQILANEAAQRERLVIPQNMRLAGSSVIRLLFEADGNRDASRRRTAGSARRCEPRKTARSLRSGHLWLQKPSLSCRS